MLKLGIMISGSGTNLQAIIDACENGYLDARPTVVISNIESAFGLERAKKHGIKAIFIDPKEHSSRQSYDSQTLEVLKDNMVDLVVHAGYMRLIGEPLLSAYSTRTMNIHPSLLPSFPGMTAIKDAYEYGAKITGVTVHFIDAGVDTGPVILQEAVPVQEDDTLDDLEAKVHAVEYRLYPRAIKLFIENRLDLQGRKVKINN